VTVTPAVASVTAVMAMTEAMSATVHAVTSAMAATMTAVTTSRSRGDSGSGQSERGDSGERDFAKHTCTFHC
jgi:hypothetical protein